MKKTIYLSLLPLLVSFSAACGGPSKSSTTVAQNEPPAEPLPVGDVADEPSIETMTIPSSPVDAPLSLMADLQLSNPNHQITQIATFVDAVQPGMGAFVTPQTLMQMFEGMVGAVGIAGIDLNAPTYVTILDGERFVMIATVASEAELMDSLASSEVHAVTHDGFAAIGKSAALLEVAPYALSNLVKKPVADKPTISLHVGNILGGGHGEQIRSDIRGLMSAQDIDSAVSEVFIEAINNVAVLHTSLDATPAGATLVMQAIVKQGQLRDFVAQQKASDYSVVSRVGTGPWSMLAGGRIDLSILQPMLTKLAAAENNPVLTQLAQQLSKLNGEMALALNMPTSPEMVFSMQLADPAGLTQIIDSMAALAAGQKDLNLGEIPTTLKVAALKTKGGSLHELKLKPETDFQKELYGKKGVSAFFGVATGSLIATFGSNAKKYANVLVSATGKLGGKGKKLAAAVEQSKLAGESLFFAMDALSLQGGRPPKDVDPLVLGIGFSGDSMTARIVVPTEFVKEAAMGGM